jgi:PadR family transcriptional regulator PadR
VAAHDPQMLKGVLSLLLLELVAGQEDYGYSIVVRLRDRGFPDLTEGTVYPALSRLEAAGLLGSRLVRSASGPARKYYSLTEAGQVELGRGLAAWASLVSAVDRVLGTRRPS